MGLSKNNGRVSRRGGESGVGWHSHPADCGSALPQRGRCRSSAKVKGNIKSKVKTSSLVLTLTLTCTSLPEGGGSEATQARKVLV
jgi:hypothetical protein